MINSIISAISKALYSEFGEGYEIYTEKIEQGLSEPCFFISSLTQNSSQFFSSRYKKNNLFSIQYFPSSQEIKAECNDVAERLNECLEWIEVDGDLIRGTNLSSEIADDVLNFTLNYNFFAVSKSNNDVDTMEEFGFNTNVERNG